jgi:hypothetical protein
MSQTPFGPSLKLVGKAYMRNLSGFANLRSILVFWIFLRTGMPFFFFKFKSVQGFLVFLVERGRPLLVLFPFTVTNLFGFPRMISLQHAADRRYV